MTCRQCGAPIEADVATDICPSCTTSEEDKGALGPASPSHPRVGRMAKKLLLASVLPLIGAIIIVAIAWLRDQLFNHLPVAAQASYNRASALLDQGKPDEAIAELRETIRLAPEFALAHHDLGYALGLRGEWRASSLEYRKAIEYEPDYAEGHLNLGHSLLECGEPDEAIVELHRAISLKPDYGEAYAELGKSLSRQQKFEEAIAAFREAVRLLPASAEAHSNLGVSLVRFGKTEDGIIEVREAIRIKPDEATAHYNLANALIRLGSSHDEAIREFREAIRLDPGNVSAHNDLGAAFSDQGKWDEAIAELRKAVQFAPDHAGSHSNLGVAFRHGGRIDEAIGEFRAAIQLGPSVAEFHNGLAWTMAMFPRNPRRDDAEALEHARKAVELAPNAGHCCNTLALAEYRSGHWAESLAASERSLALKKGDDECAWFLLAMAHWQKGDKDEARTWFKKAVDWTKLNAPGDTEMRRLWSEAAKLLGTDGPVVAGFDSRVMISRGIG
jgi:tetratricopeptide (TPR) repeat protein